MRRPWTLLAVLAPLAAPRAQEAAAPGAAWERVLPGRALAWPDDHGAHPAFQSEWWYLTAQLEDAAGRRYGAQLTFFRRGLDARASAPGDAPLRARQVLAGHLALADLGAGRMRFAQRLRRVGSPLASAAQDDLRLVLEDWSLERTAQGRLVARAADPAQGIELALELAPAKPLVLHGAGGVSAKGPEPGNASVYASWTRLAARGTLAREPGAAPLAVTGSAWFDHEFGSSVLPPGVAGWDWLGLQLDDGRELMAFVLRAADGSATPASAATLVARDGSARALGAHDFALRARGRWTSPRTGAVYPAGWTLAVPAEGIALSVEPLLADAELDARASSGVVYWEGPVSVAGSAGGRGYAELTGYAADAAPRF